MYVDLNTDPTCK